jgi:hypothetical protein
MRKSPILFLFALLFLSSCSNNPAATETKTTDSVTTVDTLPRLDAAKDDTVTVKKTSRATDEERDMKIMDDIIKKRKTIK